MKRHLTRRFVQFAGAALVSALLLPCVGCGGKAAGAETPAGAVVAFFDALQAGDAATASALLDPTCPLLAGAWKDEAARVDAVRGIAQQVRTTGVRIRIQEVEQWGSRAVVRFTLAFADGEAGRHSLPLRQVFAEGAASGGWSIVHPDGELTYLAGPGLAPRATVPPAESPPGTVVEPPVKTPAAPVVEPPVKTPAAPVVEPPVETPAAPVVEPPVETPAAPVVEPPVETPAAPVVEPPVETPAAPVVEPPVKTPAGPEPVIPDEEISDHVETDEDLPFEEAFGEEGISDAPFTGPAGLGGAGSAFRGRARGRAGTGGGRRRARVAVEDALKWLKAHQAPNGGWEAATFMAWCEGKHVATGPDGAGKAHYDPGVTGLALCAFLGAGYTNRGQHPFAVTVARGLRYLKNVQDPEGCFGPRSTQHYIYNHAAASLAMVEAYGMTGSPIFKGSAQRALDFIALSRNPYFAWRYGVKPGDNDSSVTGWMVMVLKSAQLINEDATHAGKPAPLRLDDEAFDGVRAWIDKMTDPDYGRTGYIQRGGAPARPQELIDRFPGDKSESMTGVGMLARIFLGENPATSEIVQKGARLCAAVPPTWNPNDGSIDMYYWYYATLAMYQVGGPAWKRWDEHLKTAVVDRQRQDTDYCLYKGSWDPLDPWGPDGGRVYATAILAMCLEVYYRYDRLFGVR